MASNKKSNIQHEMFLEMKEKKVFQKAQTFAHEYLDQVFDRNIFPTDQAIDNLRYFDEAMPASSSGAIEVIELLNRYGTPATVAMLGGRYFGFVNGSAVPTGLAAKSLATFWDQNTAMQVISPIASKLESVVEGWLKEIFRLPAHTVAGFVSGTSSANLCGLAAARYRILKRMNWDVNEKGLFDAPKLRLVVGKQAHSTVHKALQILGLGLSNVEWADVDDQGRIIPSRLPRLDERTILILQAGNVSSGSFDFFDEICQRANESKSWVHIDGAFGLWAAAVDQLKALTRGMEKADSWAVDGHKTLNTPYDCGIVLCADKEAIVSALHMTGSYIVLGESRDGMFFTPEMSRRARIVELWATLKYLGKSGIDEMVLGLHERAVQFANEIQKVEGFVVLNEVVFNQVLVKCETDELTTKTMERIQQLRECWAGGSSWQNKKVIRVSVCSWATTSEDVLRSVNSFKIAFQQVMKESHIMVG
jgi:glutamate/tyrosine decarboxylase-like PLP-dependent enzyme